MGSTCDLCRLRLWPIARRQLLPIALPEDLLNSCRQNRIGPRGMGNFLVLLQSDPSGSLDCGDQVRFRLSEQALGHRMALSAHEARRPLLYDLAHGHRGGDESLQLGVANFAFGAGWPKGRESQQNRETKRMQ